jgi:hypothetical protein
LRISGSEHVAPAHAALGDGAVGVRHVVERDLRLEPSRQEWLADAGLTVESLDAGYARSVVGQADALFDRIALATGGERVGPSQVLCTGPPRSP